MDPQLKAALVHYLVNGTGASPQFAAQYADNIEANPNTAANRNYIGKAQGVLMQQLADREQQRMNDMSSGLSPQFIDRDLADQQRMAQVAGVASQLTGTLGLDSASAAATAMKLMAPVNSGGGMVSAFSGANLDRIRAAMPDQNNPVEVRAAREWMAALNNQRNMAALKAATDRVSKLSAVLPSAPRVYSDIPPTNPFRPYE
jgi:hypothetical protein